MTNPVDDDELYVCRRCRYEGTSPHPWCGTIGCEDDECLTPDLPQILHELQSRFGIVVP